MNRLLRVVGVALSLVALVGMRASALTIVEDGEPKASIVLAKQANEKAKLAADELQAYIERISGARLSIVTDADDPRGPLVLVGSSTLTDRMGLDIPSGLTDSRRDEGFVNVCRGERLVLAGNDAGPYHGTEYAVYELLRSLGVRWYMPGEYGEYVPQLDTVTVPEMRVRETPDFMMRNWWLHAQPELREPERRWKIRNKMNPDAMFDIPGDSHVRQVLPPAEEFETRPELFAMNQDGSHNPHHPNHTNPETIEIAAEIIKEYFRQNPDANSYGFAPDDGLPRDYSPDTLKLHRGFVDLIGRPGVAAEASTTEEWLHFVNAVTREVRAEFPDVYIATNGYANRNLPPQGMELDDHLIIMFAAIWSCTIHAYDDPHCWQKVRQGQRLRQWADLCDNVWIYGYNYNMLVSGLTPLPLTRKLIRDMPLMKEWGVIGFHDETRNIWAECGITTRYLRAQLEWDADADATALLDEFFAHWYGAAAEPMQAYYDALEDAIEKTPLHGHEDRVMPYVYSPELRAELATHLKQAERVVDDERARVHVQADRLIYDHLVAYMEMHEASWAGKFAAAAGQARKMMSLRGELHAIDPFYIWYDEERYHSGVFYWGAKEREEFYQSLAEMTAGDGGGLVALLPERAQFRTDPFDDGIAEEWYASKLDVGDWESILTTRPFYLQGYEDERGHTYLGNIWYRFRSEVPASVEGREVRLYVPELETEAWVWVNGRYVGHRPHRDAWIRPAEMELDVTDALRPGEVNTIAIRVGTSLASAWAAGGLQSRAFLYAPKE